MALRWWEVGGSYAMALVAAETEGQALAMVQAAGTGVEWYGAEPVGERRGATIPPADPPAPGLYAWFAE